MMTGSSESDIQTAIERHHIRNRELQELIASKGIDLALPRSIDLHFWASSEAAAHNLVRVLEAEGYSPVVTNPSVSDPALWNVEAQVEASPLRIVEPYFVEKLVRLAAENGGEFDGWGTSI
jgi:hypothetical protein